ncbi:hypothetical protein IAT38_002709 [Cryptococcus sp. DSM 104549]
MIDLAAHHSIAESVDSILECCGPAASDSRVIQLTGKAPHLPIPSPSSILGVSQLYHIPSDVRERIYHQIGDHLCKCRDEVLRAYREAVKQIISQEEYGGKSDVEREAVMCRVYEGVHARSVASLMGRLKEMVESRLQDQSAGRGETTKKGSTFSPDALSVLEAAYNTSTVLSQAETTLVAEEAGLTPHQVRTWFQNRRNRSKKNKGAASSGPRIVSALPKRAGGASKQKQPQDNASSNGQGNTSVEGYLSPSSSEATHSRSLKGLPRRAQTSAGQNNGLAEDNSASSSSASTASFAIHNQGNFRGARSPSITSSLSSVDTVPVNGGFISPFAMHLPNQTNEDQPSGPQINIAWEQGMLNVPMQALQGASAPQFDFTPPTPLNTSFADPTVVAMGQNMLAQYEAYPQGIPQAHRQPQTPMFRALPGGTSQADVEGCGVQQAAGPSSEVQQGMGWQAGMNMALGEMGFGEMTWGFERLESEARSGLESIESMLDAAFSQPGAFAAPTGENNTALTLSRSPQFTEETTPSPAGDLSRSSSLSVPAAGPSGSSPGYPFLGRDDGDDFFTALNGMLATPPSMSPIVGPAGPAVPAAQLNPTKTPSAASSSTATPQVTPQATASTSAAASSTAQAADKPRTTRSFNGYPYSWPFHPPAAAAQDVDVIEAQYVYVEETEVGEDGVERTVVVRRKKAPTGWDALPAFGDPTKGFPNWLPAAEEPSAEEDDVQLYGGEEEMQEQQHQEPQDSAWGWIPDLLPFESEDIAMMEESSESSETTPTGEASSNPFTIADVFAASAADAHAAVDNEFPAPPSVASSSTLPPRGFPPLPALPDLPSPTDTRAVHTQHDSHPAASGGMDVDQPPSYLRQSEGTSFSSSNSDFAPYTGPGSQARAPEEWGDLQFANIDAALQAVWINPEAPRGIPGLGYGELQQQQQYYLDEFLDQQVREQDLALEREAREQERRFRVHGMPFNQESMDARTREWENGMLDVPDDCSSGDSTGLGAGY